MQYEAKADINARPERVWEILTDAQTLATGEFGITRIEGRIAAGGRLKIWSEASPGRAFPVRVTQFNPGSLMEWSGGMPFGLFRGVRRFALAHNGEGTSFHMKEVFSGPFLPLIRRSMPDLKPLFEKFAKALKSRSEA